MSKKYTYDAGTFTVTDYSAEYLKNHKLQVQQALEACGQAAETYAVQAYDDEGIGVPTARLRSSITHAVKKNTMHLGTNVEYAIYVEMGTGAENVSGGTPKEKWFYHSDLDGKWHVGYPQRPKPFLKPAIADHIETYKKIIVRYLGKGDKA